MSETAEELRRLFGNPVRNMVHAFYDGYVEVNARFRQRAGMRAVIIRRELASCCEWCAALAGTYDIDDAPADIYRRHDNCKCMVTVRTERGTYQDVWSKKETQTQRAARKSREQELMEEATQQSESRRHMSELQLRIDEMMHPVSGERRLDFIRLSFLQEPSEAELLQRAAERTYQPNNHGIIARRIANGDLSLRYSPQKYQDHLYGTLRYNNTSRERGRLQSFLYVPEQVAEGLVYQYAGTGDLSALIDGYQNNREYVDVGFPVGVYYSLKGEAVETQRICIQYSSRSAHIYPVQER